jgi:hypothetical protein
LRFTVSSLFPPFKGMAVSFVMIAAPSMSPLLEIES